MTSFYPIAFFDYEEDPYEGFDDYDWEEESYQSSMGMFSMPCSDADEIEEVLQIQAYQQVLDMRGLREGMNAGHADRHQGRKKARQRCKRGKQWLRRQMAIASLTCAA